MTAVIVATAAIVLGSALPAEGASEVEITWPGGSSSLGASLPLFAAAPALIPTASHSEVFVISNTGPNTGFLRVTLVDVQSSDADYAAALTIAASALGESAVPVTVASATPCRVLTEGLVVGPGDIVPVTAVLALGDLEGTAGQAGAATFALRVTLSDAGPGTLAPDACGTGGTIIPGSSPAPSGSSAAVSSRAARQTAAGPAAQQNEAGASKPPSDIAAEPAPGIAFMQNTGRLFEEYGIVLLLFAFLLGMGGHLLLAWRRRRTADEEQH